jgi:hypothetical protein
LSSKLVVTTVLSLSLCAVAPVFGATIIASGAGPLPASAMDLSGQYPSEIRGTLDFPNGVSMFKFYLNAPFFSAITVLPVANGVPDPELFLFDSSGRGVYMNDDQTGSDTQSCLPSAVSNPCPSPRNGVGPATSGFYYLAITRSANMAIDSMMNPLFAPSLSTDVAGPASLNPIADWDNNVNASPNFDQINYDIFLTGAVPEPATWTLTAAAGLALFLFRKRSRS